MDFDTWLSQRLLELKTDEAVFGPYITSILEGDEELEQKIEDLDGILSELGATPSVESLTSAQIISRWNEHLATSNDKSKNASTVLEGDNKTESESLVEKQLEQLLRLSPESGGATGSGNAKGDATDSALRAAILQQYQGLTDESESDDDGESRKKSTMDGLAKNTNASSLLSAQKEMKEQAKAEAAKKREKDKEDRARQKKLAEEKKEKAKKKTAKVERKR